MSLTTVSGQFYNVPAKALIQIFVDAHLLVQAGNQWYLTATIGGVTVQDKFDSAEKLIERVFQGYNITSVAA